MRMSLQYQYMLDMEQAISAHERALCQLTVCF